MVWEALFYRNFILWYIEGKNRMGCIRVSKGMEVGTKKKNVKFHNPEESVYSSLRLVKHIDFKNIFYSITLEP